jgi:hypothetical protein
MFKRLLESDTIIKKFIKMVHFYATCMRQNKNESEWNDYSADNYKNYKLNTMKLFKFYMTINKKRKKYC